VFTGLCAACPELSVAADGAGGYFVRYFGSPDLSYALQRGSGVIGPWATLGTQAPPASGFVEFHDTNAPPGGAFYRVVLP
jgi:hypothetical protein